MDFDPGRVQGNMQDAWGQMYHSQPLTGMRHESFSSLPLPLSNPVNHLLLALCAHQVSVKEAAFPFARRFPPSSGHPVSRTTVIVQTRAAKLGFGFENGTGCREADDSIQSNDTQTNFRFEEFRMQNWFPVLRDRYSGSLN
jgi:hypothetical protein